MKVKSVFLMGLVGFVSLALGLFGMNVEAEDFELKLLDQTETTRADAASGTLLIRIPSLDELSDGDASPSAENSQPPSEPGGPGSENTDAPEFFGEVVPQSFVWVLDYSESMKKSDGGGAEDWDGNAIANASRLQVVQTEAILALRALSKEAAFDIIKLAGNDNPDGMKVMPPVTSSWQGGLVRADQDVVQSAIDFVKGEKMQWGTPIWTALRKACTEYDPEEVDAIYLQTDGAPTWCDQPGATPDKKVYANSEAKERVLTDFSQWFAPFRAAGCKFHVIKIGNNRNAGDFAEQIAVQNGGNYIQR